MADWKITRVWYVHGARTEERKAATAGARAAYLAKCKAKQDAAKDVSGDDAA